MGSCAELQNGILILGMHDIDFIKVLQIPNNQITNYFLHHWNSFCQPADCTFCTVAVMLDANADADI